MPEFKFAIGDLVAFKNATTGFVERHGIIGRENKVSFTVLERLTSECHGGTQIMYILRGRVISERIQNICEFELEPYESVSDSIDPMLLLQTAKEEFVADQKMEAAGIIMDAMNAIRKL